MVCSFGVLGMQVRFNRVDKVDGQNLIVRKHKFITIVCKGTT